MVVVYDVCATTSIGTNEMSIGGGGGSMVHEEARVRRTSHDKQVLSGASFYHSRYIPYLTIYHIVRNHLF
jgi:hypothetical protein